MVNLITAADDDSDSAILDYVRAEQDGMTKAAWFHPEENDPLLGSELGEEADDPDEWSLRWYCPRCETTAPPENELTPAGMSSIHVPCATDEELEAAEVEEQHVATNLRNAEAFEDGAFDGQGVR